MANEYARQAIHFLGGLLMVAAAVVLSQQWFVLLMCGSLVIIAVLVYLRPQFVAAILDEVDRPGMAGKGISMMLLGGLLTALLFPEQLVGALLVLAVADAAATVAGMRFGETAVPWSPRKSWVGVGVFMACSCAVLALFTPYWYAGVVPALVEAADYHDYVFLDDNLLIPLTVGALLFLL